MSETDKLAQILRYGIYAFAVITVLGGIDRYLGPFDWLVPLDSSDSRTQRSGFAIKTDHLTACQYLVTDGVAIPRLNPDGAQICMPEGE